MSSRDDRPGDLRATRYGRLYPKAKRDALLGALRDPSARSVIWRFHKALDAAYELAKMDAPETDSEAERYLSELSVPVLLEKYKVRRGDGLVARHAYLWSLFDALADGAFQK